MQQVGGRWGSCRADSRLLQLLCQSWRRLAGQVHAGPAAASLTYKCAPRGAGAYANERRRVLHVSPATSWAARWPGCLTALLDRLVPGAHATVSMQFMITGVCKDQRQGESEWARRQVR